MKRVLRSVTLLSVISTLTLVLPVACKKRRPARSGAPKPGGPVIAKGPGSSAAQAVTLQQAIASHWVKVQLMPTSDTYDRAALLLMPLVRTRPWIRIRPMWRIENDEDSKSSDMVIIAGRTVRLHRSSNLLRSLPQVQLRPTHIRGGRKGATFVLLDDDDDDDEQLLKLLAETGRHYAKTGRDRRARRRLWHRAQIAVWLLQENVSIDTLRRTVYGLSRHAGYTVYSSGGISRLVRTGEDLQRAFDLLKAAGIEVKDLEAYQEWQRYGEQLPPLAKRRKARSGHRR